MHIRYARRELANALKESKNNEFKQVVFMLKLLETNLLRALDGDALFARRQSGPTSDHTSDDSIKSLISKLDSLETHLKTIEERLLVPNCPRAHVDNGYKAWDTSAHNGDSGKMDPLTTRLQKQEALLEQDHRLLQHQQRLLLTVISKLNDLPSALLKLTPPPPTKRLPHPQPAPPMPSRAPPLGYVDQMVPRAATRSMARRAVSTAVASGPAGGNGSGGFRRRSSSWREDGASKDYAMQVSRRFGCSFAVLDSMLKAKIDIIL